MNIADEIRGTTQPAEKQIIIEKVNLQQQEKNTEVIEKAGRILRQGGLVAFPTETVYGLGADAYNISAVQDIYKVKGRPSDNPLIVHISRKEQLNGIAVDIPPLAQRLTEAFWPGPLTVILKKKPGGIPDETTGGLDTVAVRLPQNPVAIQLIEATGTPIAAPSANASGRPSTTNAAHVAEDLGSKVDMILDGGASVLGLESTVVDATGTDPVILRPGSVTAEMIQAVCGSVRIETELIQGTAPRSPGQKYTHYSPDANVTIVIAYNPACIAEKIVALTRMNMQAVEAVGVMCTDETKEYYLSQNIYRAENIISLGDASDAAQIGANLFDTLRRFDALCVRQVYAEGFAENGAWLAVMNRLKKAAGYEIIMV